MSFITRKMLTETEAVRELLASDRTEERVLSALRPETRARLAALIADQMAIQRDKELSDYEEALGLDAGIDLAALSLRSRVVIARTMIRRHRSMTPWSPNPTLSAFQARLFATVPSERDQTEIWTAATSLSIFHPAGRDSAPWNGILDHLAFVLNRHASQRADALARADEVAAMTDLELEDFLYNREEPHEECELLAMSKVPRERLDPILAVVRRQQRLDEEDEIEARQSKW